MTSLTIFQWECAGKDHKSMLQLLRERIFDIYILKWLPPLFVEVEKVKIT